MLVDPLQPIVTTGWFPLHDDQYRLQISITPGLTGVQPENIWLSLLKTVVQVSQVLRVLVRAEILVPLLSAVSWIREKTGVAPPRSLTPLFLSFPWRGVF